MHWHIDPGAIRRNDAFSNPAKLFIIPDHYLVRLLVSQGYSQRDLGVAPLSDNGDRRNMGAEADRLAIWRLFAENWKLFRGTPKRYWLEHELVEIFGVSREPSAEAADLVYDEIEEALSRPELHIRPMFDRFNIKVFATTDPADSALEDHAALAAERWGDRVIPTFPPDNLFYPHRDTWQANIVSLDERNGTEIGDFPAFHRALQDRRFAFVADGARATDHGHLSADTTPLDHADAQRIFLQALLGSVDAASSASFEATMLFESARMSLDDGLVMQLHPGVLRDHSDCILKQFGPDKGFEIPVPAEFTRSLLPLLEALSHEPGFRMILFTVDEDVYSRGLAPIAGAYPGVKLGAPWWFLDSPGGMAQFRELTTETAGFYNTSGFVDDTRAFASIPARHDLARRIDAGYLAKLLCEHRLSLDEAPETAVDLAYNLPPHVLRQTRLTRSADNPDLPRKESNRDHHRTR